MHKMRLKLAKLKALLLLGVLTIKNLLMAKPVDYTIGQLRKKLKEQGWQVWAFDGENQSRTYYAKHLKTGEEFDGTLAEFKLLAKNVLSL
jgi:hypothetical protein